MPPSRATLNQPVNLNSANALYNHAVSTGAVHGLPTGANVLGDKTGSGRFIQTQTGTGVTCPPGCGCNASFGYNGIGANISWPIAYASTPICLSSGGLQSGNQTLSDTWICGVNSSGCIISCLGYSGYTCNVQYFVLTIGV